MPLRLMISFGSHNSPISKIYNLVAINMGDPFFWLAADFFRLLWEYALSPSSLVLGLIDIYSDCWMSGRCPPLAWCQACWSTWTPSGGRTPSTHSSQAQVYTGSKCSINPYRFLHAVFLDGLIEKVHICRIKIFIRMLKNNVLIPIWRKSRKFPNNRSF